MRWSAHHDQKQDLRKQGLDKGLKQMEDDEFSVMTEESDLQFTQNVLDFRVAKI